MKFLTKTVLPYLIAVVIVCALGLLIAFILEWSWNYTMPYLFHLPIINWGQAFWLYVLAVILVGSRNYKSGGK